ncbi:hypothetical protein [Desulfotomaculum sp. 1211_IL3151]|uniref:hypothetical protein n=1 Tax=Desulfotomaculum sp. 1211_IL3151 TaxID=3084055 RepID=UPI002FD925AA
MFFRKITTKKNGKEYAYVKLIENYRTNGKIKQRVVANFGSVENLSPERINDLIQSLKKLCKDVESQEQSKPIFTEVIARIPAVTGRVRNSPLMKALKERLNPKQYQIIEAMVIKVVVAAETNIPIQDACKEMGLVEANSIDFYKALKIIGQRSTKELILDTYSKSNTVFVHLVESVFSGTSFEVDMDGNSFLPRDYKKTFKLLLACDVEGNPLSFEVVEDTAKLAEHLGVLVKSLLKVVKGDIVVLDPNGQLVDEEMQYITAQPVKDENSNDVVYFETTKLEQKSKEKVKEFKASLAKVTAGLENIKADILLGKLSRESAVRKRADSVIKLNDFADIVNYQYHEATHTFEYQIKEAALKEKTFSVVTTTWGAPKEKFKGGWQINRVEIKTEPYENLTDQLVIPPISMYADYHYSTEIISGHIALEIIKTQ